MYPKLSERVNEAIDHIRKARDLMASGPLDFYLESLAEHSEALLTKFTPIKLGSKAVIVKAIDCSDGWRGCERTLQVGSIGTVEEVDYRKGRFVFSFKPDVEWWKDYSGEWHQADVPHLYSLTENQISALK